MWQDDNEPADELTKPGSSLTEVEKAGRCMHVEYSPLPAIPPERCNSIMVPGELYCQRHANERRAKGGTGADGVGPGSRAEVLSEKQNTIVSFVPTAITTLAGLLNSMDENVRLKAAIEFINRSGIPKTGETINVNVNVKTDATEALKERLTKMVNNKAETNKVLEEHGLDHRERFDADPNEEVLEAEIVD